ncbi:hypothetical protein ESCO_005574 [Escovopsis weberi]|uniref:Uncharacterized protein n=1 Tax=Escovopsis weberi TaxID=150374 RepID=A0A0M8N3U6_ESCWE|nr:hypothetical protein ESCO_005574 [Escovopsis weberi]
MVSALENHAFSPLDGVDLAMGGDFESLLHELRRVRRRHTAGQAEAQTRNLLSVSEMNRRITLALARSVIQELRMRPFGNDPRNSSGNTSYVYSSDQFLVTERDIQNIIERSLLLMDDEDLGEDDDESMSEDASPRRKSFSAVNLDSLSKGIRPRPSIALDPATTISVPKTLFSRSSRHGRRPSRAAAKERNRSMTATIISRRSVAEITWTKNGGHLGDISDDSDEGSEGTSDGSEWAASPMPSPAANMPPKDYLRQRRPTRRPGSFRDHLVSSSITYHSPGNPPAQVTFKIGEIPSSNAALRTQSRGQQDYFNWAEPIVWMGDSEGDRDRDRDRAFSTDMYDHEVDAHSGMASRRQTLFTEDELHRRWTTNRSILDSSGPCAEAWLARRATLASPSLARADHQDSAAIPFRDRCRSVPGLGTAQDPRKGSARSTLMDRVMSTGQRLISGGVLGYKRQRSDDYDGFDEDARAWALPPNNSPSSAQKMAYHSPLQGPYDKGRTGALRRCQRADGRKHTCSEDGRPHICENDEDSSSRE